VVARLSAAAMYVAVGRGAPGAAERFTKLRTKLHYDPQIALLAGGCGADLLQWQGDVAGARAAIDDAIDELGQKWGQWQLGGIWLAALGVSAEADRAAEARLRRETAEERAAVADGTALLEHARTTARLGRPRGATLGPEGRAWLERAEAEGARLRGEADPEAWQRSTDAFGYGYVYEQARSHWRLAEALLARDRRDEAAEQARTAYEAAVRLGAAPLRDAVAALARRGRLEIGLPLQFPDDALLTPRERDVLKLLAEGRTNRQIGRSLFISEKTASVHVSNIIGKLGASGRTEAVAIAHRRGLLTPTPRQAAEAGSGPPTAS
jgi:DNA-binding CsgD family transcriptional regulator